MHAVDKQLIAQQGVSLSQLAAISDIMSAIGSANTIQIYTGETVLIAPAIGFFSSSVIVATLALSANIMVVSRNKNTLDSIISYFGEDKL